MTEPSNSKEGEIFTDDMMAMVAQVYCLHVGDLGLLNINYAGTIIERAVPSTSDQFHGL